MNKLPFRMSDDGPEETKCWFTVCCNCDWEEDEYHAFQDDCTVSECPECGSDDIEDRWEWA